ncbi:hypothetical protein [Phenylobacterium sp.]|uniref:hypothetical protein n=1 Tax=Phenylobacterium sp. TaxID=1871053 RepID=UPI00261DEB64|nr:hypothetical protein [Phenylobacterium sp.]
MIAMVLGLLVVFGRLAPASMVGRPMWRLAERIAERVSRIRTVHVVLAVAALASLAALIAYAQIDGAMIALPVGADGLAYLAAVDVGTYVEVMALACLLGAAGAIRAAGQVVRAIAGRRRMIAARRTRRRVRRTPAAGRRRPPGRDDDDPAVWAPLPIAA